MFYSQRLVYVLIKNSHMRWGSDIPKHVLYFVLDTDALKKVSYMVCNVDINKKSFSFLTPCRFNLIPFPLESFYVQTLKVGTHLLPFFTLNNKDKTLLNSFSMSWRFLSRSKALQCFQQCIQPRQISAYDNTKWALNLT